MTNDIGVVIIGRNEGLRLRRCFGSVSGKVATIVYVDACSTDDSIVTATEYGAIAVSLAQKYRLCPAFARNEGFRNIKSVKPDLSFIQFIDGDCEVVAGWLEEAAGMIGKEADAAIVIGVRRERFPERSLYNAFRQIEADIPRKGACFYGGNFMVRTVAFEAAGGFNESLSVGEDTELFLRLRNLGWRVISSGKDMVLHDADSVTFRQWSRRQIRGGYGAAKFARTFTRHDNNAFVKEVLSVRIWTIGWLAAMFVCWLITGASFGRMAARTVAVTVFFVPLVQIFKIAFIVNKKQRNFKLSLAYAFFTMLGKWIQLWAHIRYYFERLRGNTSCLQDYKDRQ